MHSIGETARASGLTVSALRFYDAAGVLVPAAVDPHTGYRWYAVSQLRAARLLAGLRRVGLPLAEITEAVRALPDVTVARRLLDVHLRRLQDGLADARRELSRIHALLDAEENRTTMTTTTTRVTVDAADLAGALDAVRFAVGTDPEIPALAGVHVEVSTDAVRLAATDRYRMAVAELVPTAVDGPAVTVLVPGGFVTGVRSQVDRNPVAELAFGPDGVDACAPGWRITTDPLDHDFPDYRPLLPVRGAEGRRQVTVDATELRRALAPDRAPAVVREHLGVAHPVAVLAATDDGTVECVDEAAWQAAPDRYVAVNREFLLQAVVAAGGGQLVLELDGPIRPLAVRLPDDDRSCSLLMPIRH
ncbi:MULTISPECIES: MerR family DNA-binding transcriptional regulator [unclassified Solwaraspora]|uniref:DNA polymerase III subunit beta family protein n=1 Tax=unclassified Solwaraspora TaxID=2627926 RepID=UPI00248B76EB|nr:MULTISPECIES: MerR family DNA-binding transcriptional regulator [unclassified Solwaraspora]WBC00126.1 MerR family DNA-binding transcriptional regulator [Solwaraspora sp. WMMA2059]WBC23811.1 MerR family DNA-binding transcriptional regulator [Solwaraspora sp. WMMA2080]WJK37968.1 MerR family DNA-binding transcriptional regulator [Solwaraspora sp. WMMA2065]